MIGDGLDEIGRCAGGNGQIVCHVGGIDGGLLVDIAGVVLVCTLLVSLLIHTAMFIV